MVFLDSAHQKKHKSVEKLSTFEKHFLNAGQCNKWPVPNHFFVTCSECSPCHIAYKMDSYVGCNLLTFIYEFLVIPYLPSKHINVESTLKQHWSSMFIPLCHCFNVDIWLKMKGEPTYVYRRCFNVDKTTLKQHWKNYASSMLMTQCCLNVDIWLKMKVVSLYIHRRFFDVEKTVLKQLCELLHWSILMFTRKLLKSKTKLSFQE